MSDLDTDPTLQGVIIQRLNAWRYQHTLIPFPNIDEPMRRMVALQDRAGWQCAFEGRWVFGWKELQEAHYKRTGSQRSGKQWLAKIIRRIWDISWAMWNKRNKFLHDKNSKLLGEQQLITINAEYEQGFTGFSPRIRYLTGLTKEEVIKKTVEWKAMWTTRIQTFRRERDALTTEALAERIRTNRIIQLRQDAAKRRGQPSTPPAPLPIPEPAAPAASSKRKRNKPRSNPSKRTKQKRQSGRRKTIGTREERAQDGASNQDHGLGNDGPPGPDQLAPTDSRRNAQSGNPRAPRKRKRPNETTHPRQDPPAQNQQTTTRNGPVNQPATTSQTTTNTQTNILTLLTNSSLHYNQRPSIGDRASDQRYLPTENTTIKETGISAHQHPPTGIRPNGASREGHRRSRGDIRLYLEKATPAGDDECCNERHYSRTANDANYGAHDDDDAADHERDDAHALPQAPAPPPIRLPSRHHQQSDDESHDVLPEPLHPHERAATQQHQQFQRRTRPGGSYERWGDFFSTDDNGKKIPRRQVIFEIQFHFIRNAQAFQILFFCFPLRNLKNLKVPLTTVPINFSTLTLTTVRSYGLVFVFIQAYLVQRLSTTAPCITHKAVRLVWLNVSVGFVLTQVF